jgi:hypothetical protein
LLALASQYFDVFVTVDRNLAFQQNVAGVPIAIIVLQEKSNRLADLKRLAPQLLASIELAQRGNIERVGEP